MRQLFIVLSLWVLTTTFVFPQHYEWTVRTIGGEKYASVHPDTIRNSTLTVSQEVGTVYRIPLDSLRSLIYEYDPVWITLTAIGAVIGAAGNDNIIDRDHTGGISVTGAAFGAATGFLLSSQIGNVREEIMLEGTSNIEKIQKIRRGVPKRSGRVAVFD